jgi:hypothetical protein
VSDDLNFDVVGLLAIVRLLCNKLSIITNKGGILV